MDLEQLATALSALGCPAEKCNEMAGQLDKRAKQLAEERKQTYDQSMVYLLGLMKEGWAAKERGI